MSQTVERGGLHLFYRAKMDVQRVQTADDLQRVFLVLVPDDRNLARILLVGRKVLPDILPGETHPTERDWLMVTAVGPPSQIADALRPERYDTKTRGTRESPEALPAGAARYAIVRRDGDTQLALRLVRPDRPGPAQEALNLPAEARYVLSVRNPDIGVPGFPDARPDYPQELRDRFADERWIAVTDPRLIDHETAQLVLIGAREDTAALEADLSGDADPYATFGLDGDDWPDTALASGRFAEPGHAPEPIPGGDRSTGGERGGAAATRTGSAAGVARSLKGMSFPADPADLARQARRNDAPDAVIDLIEALPERRYETMADVAEAVGEVR